MQLRAFLLALALIAGLGDAGHSATSSVRFRGARPISAGTLWSTLGVVADGVTDNTTALNAINWASVGQVIGDCPAGGTIKFSGQWLWKSGMALAMNPGCSVVTTYAAATDLGFASITQSDLTVPLDTVVVDGLYLRRLESPSIADTLHRSYFLNVNHFKLTNFTIDVYHQGFYLIGSDVEIAYGQLLNGCTVVGCDGLRQIGNVPKVASSLPANWYVHDNVFASGDAPFQACQPKKTDIGLNLSTDDVLFKNNFGSSVSSVVALIGEDNLPANASSVTCTNIVFDNVSGAGGVSSVKISSSFAPMVVQNVTVKNATYDITVSGNPLASIQVLNELGGNLDHVTIDNVHAINIAERALSVIGTTFFSLTNSTLGEASSKGLANVYLSGDSDSLVSGNTINAHLGAGIIVGNPSQTLRPSITGNTLKTITANQSGVLLLNVDQGSVTSNTMLRGAGQVRTRGATFTDASLGNAGTTNTTMSGNNVSNMNNSPTIVFTCNGGTTNSATSNTGSPNYTCP